MFAAAAAQNAVLENELSWSFGGKEQRGWYLYSSLIGRILNTGNGNNSVDFAATLAGWQKNKGLNADGVLSEDRHDGLTLPGLCGEVNSSVARLSGS